MNKIGWLVNDQLTCIPGTKTLWHDLLDWLPGLVDKTGDHTPFPQLASKTRNEWLYTEESLRPDYIIRNGTFFERFNLYGPPIINLIQDVMPTGHLRNQQLSVAHEATKTVFNSEFTKSKYPELQNTPNVVIPLGVDFKFFEKGWPPTVLSEILPKSILFVGAENIYPKGFDRVMELINSTDYNFCLVMKDDFKIEHPRVRVFNRVNQMQMRQIYCSCSVLICPSRMETQHLAGIEAAACGLPIIATNVGIYNDANDWGIQIDQNISEAETIKNFKLALSVVFKEGIVARFSPRSTMLCLGYDKYACADKWQKLVYECTHPHH